MRRSRRPTTPPKPRPGLELLTRGHWDSGSVSLLHGVPCRRLLLRRDFQTATHPSNIPAPAAPKPQPRAPNLPLRASCCCQCQQMAAVPPPSSTALAETTPWPGPCCPSCCSGRHWPAAASASRRQSGRSAPAHTPPPAARHQHHHATAATANAGRPPVAKHPR